MLHDIVFDKLLGLWIVAALLWSHVVSEWVGYWIEVERNPILYTVVAIVVTLYAGLRGYLIFKKARDHNSGRRGEQTVAEYMDRLREKGHRVYRDIPGESGNIDHVIVGTQGIFTVETRTGRKPENGDPIVEFDGKAISVIGRSSEGRPIAQVRAQAKKLESKLQEQTGQVFSVAPIIVYPGWFVRSRSGAKESEVSVLNPKSLQDWITRRPDILPAEQVNLIGATLAKLMRDA